MHRRPLLKALRHYAESHREEQPTIDRFVAFVESNPDCFSRSLSIGHVTGSAWLVDRAGERILLTHHRKLNRWLQLGGHADGEPDVLAVARREAVEESGIEDIVAPSASIFDVDIHEIPERGAEPAHEHFDVRFVLQTGADDRYIVSDESHDLAWVPIADLRDYTDEESVLRMARKWLARQNAP